jgi:hypothetical protein
VFRHLFAVVPLALLVACGAGDADEDGLTNAEEKEAGTDKKLADSDGDGLNDFDEVKLGANPLKADSDGDGMSDGDEVLYGRDALDDKVGAYEGEWPLQTVAMKEEIVAAKRSPSVIKEGARFPRLTLRDQFGDKVDLYDFAGQGKGIIIDLSAFNCGPCLATGEWMESDLSSDEVFGDGGALDPIRDAIEAGELYWLTVVYSSFSTPSESTRGMAKDWYDDFPNPAVPVFEDPDMEVWDFAYDGGMPSFAYLNDRMIVKAFDLGIGAENAALAEALLSVE